jgi:predicted ribosomally synthesized peptide with nif11-like leader
MSGEGARALCERISSDEQFRAQFEAAGTLEEKRRIVTDAGCDVSSDDLSTIRKLADIERAVRRVSGAGVGRSRASAYRPCKGSKIARILRAHGDGEALRV